MTTHKLAYRGVDIPDWLSPVSAGFTPDDFRSFVAGIDAALDRPAETAAPEYDYFAGLGLIWRFRPGRNQGECLDASNPESRWTPAMTSRSECRDSRHYRRVEHSELPAHAK